MEIPQVTSYSTIPSQSGLIDRHIYNSVQVKPASLQRDLLNMCEYTVFSPNITERYKPIKSVKSILSHEQAQVCSTLTLLYAFPP